METSTLVWLLPAPPLLAFFLIILLTNRSKSLSHFLGIGAALLSFIGSMVIATLALQSGHLGEEPFTSVLNWFPTGDTWFQIGVWVENIASPMVGSEQIQAFAPGPPDFVQSE